jgi:hypothetical protein
VSIIMISFLYLIAFFHSLDTRYLSDDVCAAGPAGFAAKYVMSAKNLSRKVDSLVIDRKPANKLSSKRCGLAAGREPTRLQAYGEASGVFAYRLIMRSSAESTDDVSPPPFTPARLGSPVHVAVPTSEERKGSPMESRQISRKERANYCHFEELEKVNDWTC